MKKLKLFIGLFFLLTANLFAQQGINYKAILSDNGAVLQNQAVDVQFTILRDGVTTEYQETHSTTTDANGIIILTIGEGTVLSGLYNSIHWYAPQFLKVEIDTGSGYTDFGTTAFKTVPYAIYAENGNGARSINDLTDAKKDITSIFLGNESGSIANQNTDNTAVGNFALQDNTTGFGNSVLGLAALSNNTSGGFNTAIGSAALFENLIGHDNTSLGYNAGYNSIGDNNIFIGYRAGYNETGNDKLYIENSDSATPLIGGDFSTDEVTINGSIAILDGSQGLNKILTSDDAGKASWQLAPASGAMAINELSDAKTDVNSLFLGAGSGALDDGDNNNVGIGNQTLAANTTGEWNTAIGGYALKANTEGRHNTAMGYQTLIENTTGIVNVANGAFALKQNTTGNNNIAIGAEALYYNTIGNNNTALGYLAGHASAGDGNIFIGNQAGRYEHGSDKLYIENTSSSAPLIGGDFATDEVTINGTLDVTGKLTATEAIINGSLEVTGDIIGKLTATDSGDADLKAYIYGSITSMGPFTANGAQTDGFDVTRIATGVYDVVFTNPPGNNLYTVISSMRYGDIGFISVNNATDKFTIRTYNTSGVAADKAFNFVVYKK